MNQVRLGIDIGATNTKAALVSAEQPHAVVWRETNPTPRDYPALRLRIEQIIAAARLSEARLKAARGQGNIEGIGLSVPATVDSAGAIIAAGEARWLVGQPLKRDVEALAGCPVSIENDERCFAIAEYHLGEARGANPLAAIAIGTGMAAGLMIGGKLYRGAFGGAGELGHTIVKPGASDAELETYDSEHFFARQGTTAETSFALAQQGNAEALRQWEEFGQWLGLALVNLIDIIEPAAVVIGGGLSRAAAFFLPSAQAYVKDHAHSPLAVQNTKIFITKLGVEAQAIGAALLTIYPS